MKRCEYPGEQEKCVNYQPKDETPGKADLTCIYWRRDYLGHNGGSICDQEWKEKAPLS